jgi:hypothetical protein
VAEDTPSTEALTPDEERALRVALEHGEAWPRTTAYSLIPVLLATRDWLDSQGDDDA